MFVDYFINWMFPTPKSATETINEVLSGFTSMVDTLDDAIVQANDEISASYDRSDAAYNTYLAVSHDESVIRAGVAQAAVMASNVRSNIAALLGEPE
jgi:hypothetical protein